MLSTLMALALGAVSVDRPARGETLVALEQRQYAVEVAAGPHRIAAAHAGADIVMRVLDSAGAVVYLVDLPGIEHGHEYFFVEPVAPVTYRIEIARGEGDGTGRYDLLVQPLDAEQAQAARQGAAAMLSDIALDKLVAQYDLAIASWQRLGNLDEQARLRFSLATRYRDASRLDSAADEFLAAAGLWQQAGLTRQALWARYRDAALLVRQSRLDDARIVFEEVAAQAGLIDDHELTGASRNYAALTFLITGDLVTARQAFVELVPFLEEHRLHHKLATVFHNLAGTYYESGDPSEAEYYFERAIATARALDPEADVSAALEELGGLYALMGRCDRAFEYLYDALSMLRRPAPATGKTLLDKQAQGRILNRMGNCHRTLGALDKAREFYEQARTLRLETDDRRGLAYTDSNLGDVYRLLGQPRRALQLHIDAVASHETRKDNVGLVTSLIAVAGDHVALGEFDAALRASGRAVQLAQQQGYIGYLARALQTEGDAQAGRGAVELALERFDQALALHQRTRSGIGELETLTAKAMLLAQSGDRDAAERLADRALRAGETLRAEIGSADLRARFQEALQSLYLLRLGLLVEDDAAEPGIAIEQSLILNDQRRARVLREQLHLQRDENVQPVLQRIAELRAGLNAKLTKREDAQNRGNAPQQATLSSQIGELRIELLRLEDTLAGQTPDFDRMVSPPALDTVALQARLPPHTVVVDFALGATRTYVWFLTADDIGVEVYGAIPAVFDVDSKADLAMAHAVLAAVFETLDERYPQHRDLIVIPDGALALVPFASIELVDGSLLIDEFALSFAPALSLVVAPQAGRRIHSLALIGDPVFRKELAPTNLQPVLRSFDAEALSALPYSGLEVRKIRDIAQPRDVLLLQRYEASKTRVLGEAMTGHDVIHFATHAFVNPALPELSGLVLTLEDADGNRMDGFLNLSDVYGLGALDASLVVLSGCRTASGRFVRGEGAMSLARAFMQNGVESVLASRWDVPDRATSELMIAFYRNLLEEGVAPAESLARAQRAVKRRPRWRDPLYWAGFSLWSAATPARPAQ